MESDTELKSRIDAFRALQLSDEESELIQKRQILHQQRPPPTLEELEAVKQNLWLTLVSCPHPMLIEGIESHFRIDTGDILEDIGRAFGFRTTEAFILSEHFSEFIREEIIKDELDEFARRRFYATSIEDVVHITNVMTETKMNEKQKEAAKEFHKTAKYSTVEFKEKTIEMRERIATVAYELMKELGTEQVSWQQIQTKFPIIYDQQLTKKYLRTAFPTGHASHVLEKCMHEEFILTVPEGLTGTLFVAFRSSYQEVLEMYKAAREYNAQQIDVMKTPQFRTADNKYVDYVRERQRKNFLYQQKEQSEQPKEKGNENEFLSKLPSSSTLRCYAKKSGENQALKE